MDRITYANSFPVCDRRIRGSKSDELVNNYPHNALMDFISRVLISFYDGLANA